MIQERKSIYCQIPPEVDLEILSCDLTASFTSDSGLQVKRSTSARASREKSVLCTNVHRSGKDLIAWFRSTTLLSLALRFSALLKFVKIKGRRAFTPAAEMSPSGNYLKAYAKVLKYECSSTKQLSVLHLMCLNCKASEKSHPNVTKQMLKTKQCSSPSNAQQSSISYQ